MKLMRSVIFSILAMTAAGTSLAGESNVALLGDKLFPEGIAYDARTKTYYVGSAADGAIQIITNGAASAFQPAGTDGRVKALGINVDADRDRLFIAAADTVYIYKISTNTLLRKLALKDLVAVEKSALNDLAIDGAGNAYVTDSFNPHVLRIDGVTLDMTVFADVSAIPYGNQNEMPYNLNGIVLTRDHKALILVKTNDGTLWRLDLKNKKVREIALSEPVLKGDGLVWGKGNTLYVIRNFVNKISAITLRNRGISKVRDLVVSNVKVPTTAVFVGGKRPHLMIVNSQFDTETPVLPFSLTKIEL